MGENKYVPRGLCYRVREPVTYRSLCRREDTGIPLEGKEIWHVPLETSASCYRHQIVARPESERCIHAADMAQTQVAAG